MTERKYTITVTEHQARIISDACDPLARLGIGQWPEFIKYMPDPLAFTGRHDAVQALRPVMADLLRQYSPAGAYIDGYQSHLGIFNELDCAASWLRKIEPPPAPVERERIARGETLDVRGAA